jgi:hypothetical protein
LDIPLSNLQRWEDPLISNTLFLSNYFNQKEIQMAKINIPYFQPTRDPVQLPGFDFTGIVNPTFEPHQDDQGPNL